LTDAFLIRHRDLTGVQAPECQQTHATRTGNGSLKLVRGQAGCMHPASFNPTTGYFVATQVNDRPLLCQHHQSMSLQERTQKLNADMFIFPQRKWSKRGCHDDQAHKADVPEWPCVR
jgi:hypothetical protein